MLIHIRGSIDGIGRQPTAQVEVGCLKIFCGLAQSQAHLLTAVECCLIFQQRDILGIVAQLGHMGEVGIERVHAQHVVIPQAGGIVVDIVGANLSGEFSFSHTGLGLCHGSLCLQSATHTGSSEGIEVLPDTGQGVYGIIVVADLLSSSTEFQVAKRMGRMGERLRLGGLQPAGPEGGIVTAGFDEGFVERDALLGLQGKNGSRDDDGGKGLSHKVGGLGVVVALFSSFQHGIQYGQQHQGEHGGGEESSYHYSGQRTLHLCACRSADGHGQEAQHGRGGGKHDGAQTFVGATIDAAYDIAHAFLLKCVEAVDEYQSVEYGHAAQHDESHTG